MLCITPAKAFVEYWPFAMGEASKWQNENDFQDEGYESNHLESYILEMQRFNNQSIMVHFNQSMKACRTQ